MASKRPITTPAALQEHPDTDQLMVGAGVVFAEGAAPSTPPSGYVSVYAKTDGLLYAKDDAGVEVQLGGGGAASVTVRYYTANDTWNNPAGLYGLTVIGIASGGGAGAGRRGAALSNAGGGSGGAPGCYVIKHFTQAEIAALASTVAITVPAGGTGATAQTTNSTNGGAGANGGDTSFGSLVIAKGGGGGPGGTTTTGTASTPGDAYSCTPKGVPYAFEGGPGAGSRTNSQAIDAVDGFTAGYVSATIPGIPGGGAGGGRNANGTSSYAGGNGGKCYVNNTPSGTGSPGAKDVGGAGDPGSSNVLLYLSDMTHGAGNGGHGGGCGNEGGTIAGGAGGDGGDYGPGGGGGGTSRDGANSGPGGDGGGGLLIVIEHTA